MSTVSAGAILRCSRLSEEWVFGETGGVVGGAAVMNAVTTVIELLESQGSIEGWLRHLPRVLLIGGKSRWAVLPRAAPHWQNLLLMANAPW